jgi:hypothetical protein
LLRDVVLEFAADVHLLVEWSSSMDVAVDVDRGRCTTASVID